MDRLTALQQHTQVPAASFESFNTLYVTIRAIEPDNAVASQQSDQTAIKLKDAEIRFYKITNIAPNRKTAAITGNTARSYNQLLTKYQVLHADYLTLAKLH